MELDGNINFDAIQIQMRRLSKLLKQILGAGKDENFLHSLEKVEGIVSKILSIIMVVVILVSVYDLIIILGRQLFAHTVDGFLDKTLFKIFGLFLNVLIALEILENITAYLKKHVVQVELVIVTSLIAVARKIIILDLGKASGLELISLALATFSLSISYWIIRQTTTKD